MRNFIGQINERASLSEQQLEAIKVKIKNMLQLDTIEIKQSNGGIYSVSTNDDHIVDFKINNYNKNIEVSLVKYQTYNDEMKRDSAGAILVSKDLKCKE